ncbi:hypothetical protein F5H01DRAFT_321005 [Linnemannia elongata]|nr:hypothetical protein F5H01DRAFT_321005 [Linnemannia elongata]
MKITLVKKPKNPLNLPEIRSLVASFLNCEECIACTPVSRDWFKDFITHWPYTPAGNFGGAAKSQRELLGAKNFEPCFTSSPDSVVAKAHLLRMSLNRVRFIHEGFTDILRNSPVLRRLELFRDSSVTSHEPLAEICMPDPGPGWAPSLLNQFSRLEEWHLPAVDRSKNWGNDPDFRRELRRCCPRLKTLRFDQVANTDKLSDLLLDSFIEPESCTFSAKNLSNSMVLSLVSHSNTLTTIIITDKCINAVAMRWLYLVPKSCSRLRVLSMRQLVLDMETVKENEWRCENLTELHVRFQGLEDTQLIDGCIRDMCSRRKKPYCINPGNSISKQVSNHLLEFYRLTTICLGTKVYSLPIPFEE